MGCGQDSARIGHSGIKLHTEKPESCTIHLLRFGAIGCVVLLLDEYLNSAPKPLELAKSCQPVRGQECGRSAAL